MRFSRFVFAAILLFCLPSYGQTVVEESQEIRFEAVAPINLPTFSVRVDEQGRVLVHNPSRLPVEIGWVDENPSDRPHEGGSRVMTVPPNKTVVLDTRSLSGTVFDATRHRSPVTGYSTALTRGKVLRVTTIYPSPSN